MTQDVDARLSKIEEKLEAIQEILSKMSVQSEQIATLQRQSDALWRKYDKIYDDMVLIKNWQASCPRNAMNWMWAILIPMGLTLVGMLYHVIKGGGP